MIYLINKTNCIVVGQFDSITSTKSYLKSYGITTYENYAFTEEINNMRYISRITHVDGVCIYNNKTFWINESHNIYDDYSNHIVLDFLGNLMYSDRFLLEMDYNFNRIANVTSIAEQVNYNIDIGFEFIALFREETVAGDLGSLNGLDVAAKTANATPLITTGSFKEAAYVLGGITPDEYLTTARLTKYISMLKAADIITYQS